MQQTPAKFRGQLVLHLNITMLKYSLTLGRWRKTFLQCFVARNMSVLSPKCTFLSAKIRHISMVWKPDSGGFEMRQEKVYLDEK